MEQVWARHPGTEAEKLIPRSALATLAASGWVEMTKAEVAATTKRLADERTARVASLTPSGPASEAVEVHPEPPHVETTPVAHRAPATEKE